MNVIIFGRWESDFKQVLIYLVIVFLLDYNKEKHYFRKDVLTPNATFESSETFRITNVQAQFIPF